MLVRSAAVSFVTLVSVTSAHAIDLRLPSGEVTRAIKGLRLDPIETLPPRQNTSQGTSTTSSTISSPVTAAPTGTVTIETLTVPRSTPSPTASAAPATVPLASSQSMLIQFQPEASAAEIESFVKDRNLKVIGKLDAIGAIQVETDIGRFITPAAAGEPTNNDILKGFLAAAEDFKKDPRIKAATPDTLLATKALPADDAIANLDSPTDSSSSVQMGSKLDDWGIQDIQADKLWGLPGGKDGVVFGVLDAGFSPHENLVFIDLDPSTPPSDHGNHVAGIACGTHSFAMGTRGVLPNCFVRAGTGQVIYKSNADSFYQFSVYYSQLMNSLLKFVDAGADVKSFSVSLGYNWLGNFGDNPDSEESRNKAALIESQFPFLLTMLQILASKDKVIFSAAGNDSYGRSTPVSSRFASPLNLAILVGREQGVNSGIVVEAHNPAGKRAGFSNNGGTMSCPGVNILSSVAFDDKKKLSDKFYGRLSGTSMATPYCAAGFALFRSVRKTYTSVQALDCLVQSADKTEKGVPMMRLAAATSKCP